MKFLIHKRADVSKNDNSSFVADSNYMVFALLNSEQMWYFVRCFSHMPDSFWKYVHEKTGSHHLVCEVGDGSLKKPKYKRIKCLDVEVYLAAWDALDTTINGWPTIEQSIGLLDIGESTVFNEENCIVKYVKEKLLFEHSSWYAAGGVISVLYKTPLGSVIINQNKINNSIFEIYVSNDVSDAIYNRLVYALEEALKYDHGTLKVGKRKILEEKKDANC